MPAASWRLCGGVEAVRAGCPQELEALWRLRPCGQAARSELEACSEFGGFVEVLRPCGQDARSELEALWRLRPCGQAGSKLEGAGCPQRVGGFVEVLKPCVQAARSELQAL